MFNKWLLVVMAAVSFSLVSVHSVAQQNSGVVAAPDFALQDATGKTYSLEDFKGKPLVLHFWATWCPYCKKLQPGLERLNQQYGDDITVLGISFQESEGAKPAEVLQKRGATFMTLLKGERAAWQYGVKGTPTTFVIDADGNAVGKSNTSDPNDPIFADVLDELLKNTAT